MSLHCIWMVKIAYTKQDRVLSEIKTGTITGFQ